ncbi:MAG TPA: NAD-dependent epimerase/dehydratase family protein [Myxococcaceae bacterium]|nr:NAD-dependent epimerase/dehydratase family protein [Myxococcaceae bacterium]
MRALVTGGGGFLGKRIVELLLAEGHEVRFLARNRYPEVEALGARAWAADLRQASALEDAVRGVEVVFHVAGKAGFWGSRAEYFSINADGTANLLEAARAAGVKRFVYTSTPSVIGYGADACGLSEAPYPAEHLSFYPESKAAAERMVLAANGPDLVTVSLRPHLIFGPGDPHLLPNVVHAAKVGRMAIIGDGANTVDLTYVDNAAWAHLDAERALAGGAPCAGRAYFISNGEPVRLWDWLNQLLPRVGAGTISRRLSLKAATRIGAVMEWMWRALPLRGEPRMTRFLASAFARSHWYDMGPAARDLGYRARVPMAEATDRTVAWFLQQGGGRGEGRSR